MMADGLACGHEAGDQLPATDKEIRGRRLHDARQQVRHEAADRARGRPIAAAALDMLDAAVHQRILARRHAGLDRLADRLDADSPLLRGERLRSEERRVGKEWRCGWGAGLLRKY